MHVIILSSLHKYLKTTVYIINERVNAFSYIPQNSCYKVHSLQKENINLVQNYVIKQNSDHEKYEKTTMLTKLFSRYLKII